MPISCQFFPYLQSAVQPGVVGGTATGGACSSVEIRALNCGKEGNAALPTLPQVSDATGQMNLTKLADSSPFALELLIPDDCFVLDNGLCGKIYIWKGRKANEKERQAALQVAEDFITRMRYAPNTQVRSPPCASTPSS